MNGIWQLGYFLTKSVMFEEMKIWIVLKNILRSDMLELKAPPRGHDWQPRIALFGDMVTGLTNWPG